MCYYRLGVSRGISNSAAASKFSLALLNQVAKNQGMTKTAQPAPQSGQEREQGLRTKTLDLFSEACHGQSRSGKTGAPKESNTQTPTDRQPSTTRCGDATIADSARRQLGSSIGAIFPWAICNDHRGDRPGREQGQGCSERFFFSVPVPCSSSSSKLPWGKNGVLCRRFGQGHARMHAWACRRRHAVVRGSSLVASFGRNAPVVRHGPCRASPAGRGGGVDVHVGGSVATPGRRTKNSAPRSYVRGIM